MLEELFDEFDKILKASSDSRPQAIFVLRFLEQLAQKTTDPSIFCSLPHSIVSFHQNTLFL